MPFLVLAVVKSVLVIMATGIWCFLWLEWPGGMRPNYPAKDFDPRLTGVAETAVPIMNALAEYRKVKGTYPEDYASLRPYLAVECDTHDRWHYSRDGDDYRLAISLGWDPTLIYKSAGKKWIFDPGDGSPCKPIRLEVGHAAEALKKIKQKPEK
jgi:hypothetical protein